jgi:23S rRNA G2445 N2-methylase RlmL
MNPILSRPQTFELYTSPGCLPEASLEVQELLANPWKPHKFQPILETQKGFLRLKNASWDMGCELSARASTLHDVRLHLMAARVAGWFDVPRILERQPWAALLPEQEAVQFHAEAYGTLAHAGRLEQIADELFAKHGYLVSDQAPCTQIRLTSSGEYLRVVVSLGNDALHKRGWRADANSPATLREDLASAALRRLLGFAPQVRQATQIVVPFAGSGTLGIEAWHSLFGLPPAVWGASRPWQRLTMPTAATQGWWTRRIQSAAEVAGLPPVVLVENHPEQVRELQQNMARVAGNTTVHFADAFGFRFEPQGLTLLPLHPPYGLRLSEADPVGLYRDLGQQVRQWSLETQVVGFCLCPTEETWRAFRAGLGEMKTQTSHLTQGGLDVRWCGFDGA